MFGKPERGLFDMIADATGLDAATTVMVGDRLSTDVAFARNTGMIGALVLTGETDRAALDAAPVDEHPDVVLERLDALLTAPAPPARRAGTENPQETVPGPDPREEQS